MSQFNKICLFAGLMAFAFFLSFLKYDFAQASEGHDEVELAEYMGYLQRFSQKLGFSIQGKNLKLSEFYLHEIEEILDEVKEVETYDGVPIAKNVAVHILPKVEILEKTVKKSDWVESKKSYESFIAGCNSCHVATKHEFIKILPSSGVPPFNQKFD